MYRREIMKKISYLELGSLIIIELVTMLAGINMTILNIVIETGVRIL